jgi:hypothetical protein
MEFGTYMHGNILEPEKLAEEFLHSEAETRRHKIWREDNANNPDKIVISKSEEKLARALLGSFYKNEDAINLLKNGIAESTWGAEIEGVKVKARPDYLIYNKSIIDIKTSSKALDKKEVENTCYRLGYDLSAAFYIDIVNKFKPGNYDFYFIFLNKNTLQTRVFKASEKFIQAGREKYLNALFKYKEMIADNFLDKNYYKGIITIGG